MNFFNTRRLSSVLIANFIKIKPNSNAFHSFTFPKHPGPIKSVLRPVPLFALATRSLLVSSTIHCDAEEEEKKPPKPIDPAKDRTKIIPVETSMRYLKSDAYHTTYGDEPVWVKYRRNFKGQFTPRKTRRTCIKEGVIVTGSPCPICRDEYLVLHYTNVELLKQFIHPQTGEIHDSRIIHVCQRKLLELEVSIKKAKFYGLLTHEVPFREYNYSEYYPNWQEQ